MSRYPQDFTIVDTEPGRPFEPTCTQQRGTIRFVNPQCKRLIP
jgi:hypothetical protein